FYGCQDLLDVYVERYFSSAIQPITTLGYGVFDNCSDWLEIFVPDGSLSAYQDPFSSWVSYASKISVFTATPKLVYVLTLSGDSYSVRGDWDWLNYYSTVYIPAFYNGLPVTEIACSAFHCYAVPSPERVVFEKNSNITRICDYAFHGASSLASITIPNSVTEIANTAFSGCNSLESLKVANGNAVYKSDGNCLIRKWDNVLIAGFNNSVVPDYVTGIGDWAFGDKNEFSSIVLPNDVASIGDYAFYQCYVSNITMSNNVTSIGTAAFANCQGLSSITTTDGVTHIGNSAFAGCCSLTNIALPSITSIGNYAFNSCVGLVSITFSNSLSNIGNGAFNDSCNLTSVTIPSSVTNIGDYAFAYCSKLTLYVEPANNPSNWNYWNSSNRPVVWGCTLSADKTYVVSFTKSAASISYPSASNGIKAPYREGYTFDGWAATLGGSAVYTAANVNSAPNGTTLYAIWI
ncbi:MAG: leucine-rich repeat protein, partial [Firmicutes bacterium]|nr:leucine-rich repeat protein [Bacillota bacterium]